MRYLFIGLFGIIGVLARHFINVALAHTSAAANLNFPVATLMINIVGSLLIGVTYFAATQSGYLSEDLRFGLMTGLLGGFTTFSAFSLDAATLMSQSRFAIAGLYIFGNVGGGIMATLLGISLGRKILG